jgi:dephospho-CoA kinase
VLRIGLTGGIGAGKSEVARRLASHGAVVIDADQLARQVVAPGTEGLREVVAAFGPQVCDETGALDRAALAALVFDAEPARRRLEAIIHPRVRARTNELAAAAPPDSVVVNDVPLLVEAGLAPSYQLVVVVEAAERIRLARLMRDRQMSEQQARSRIHSQTSDAARRAAADVLLRNDGDRADLHAAVDVLWHDRLVGFARNLRAGTVVRRPEQLRLVPYDPTWPEQYDRLAARIGYATGGLRTDHVGSTAVPGLLAKDVIDIQLTVADLAAADAIADRLAAAGFPPLPGEWHDTPTPEQPDPADWRKRLHGGADPGRVVHLHVRPAGSPGWPVSLLLRDWLRADPAARAEYAQLKQQLAATTSSTSRYAEAKEPWFTEALPRARRWAGQAGWRP